LKERHFLQERLGLGSHLTVQPAIVGIGVLMLRSAARVPQLVNGDA
jgi:hypothetical protein